MFELSLQFFLDKVGLYIEQIKVFGSLNLPHQVILSVCPAIFRYLSDFGWVTLVAVGGLSLIHYRLFHIFFVLVLLKADLPNWTATGMTKSEKDFWLAVILFSAVVFMWGYIGFIGATEWFKLPGLQGG